MIVCGAMPFGYGPAAKLLVLAKALKQRGVGMTFCGEGVAAELVRAQPQLFDQILPAADGLKNVHAVVSVMDRTVAESLPDVPLLVLDSLLWMRAEVPAALSRAQVYWAQNFPGLQDLAQQYGPSPTLVGPIIDPPLPRTPESLLVINMGGVAGPGGWSPWGQAYADCVIDVLVQSGLGQRFGSICLLAGQDCVNAHRKRLGSAGVRALSVDHDEAQSLLSRAAAVLTSPGLTATYESFAVGAPTWFLPPQNYSQWCILKALRSADVAGGALHWEDLAGVEKLAPRLPESVRNPVVQQTILGRSGDASTRERLLEGMRSIRADGQRGQVQQDFLKSLGDSGVRLIADRICEYV